MGPVIKIDKIYSTNKHTGIPDQTENKTNEVIEIYHNLIFPVSIASK